MLARRSKRCAVGRAFLVLGWIASVFCARGIAQQLLPAATEQPNAQMTALAERLAVQLLRANKKKPFILDLTLPNEIPCPLGAWLADRVSESLAQAHPELEVIPRSRWSSARVPAEFARGYVPEFAQNEQRARSLGAEVLVYGNFAAIPDGIGITLMASDRISGGESRFEALAEIPVTPEMQAILTNPLPPRSALQGSFKASIAGIGSPRCEICPAPEYTYVAKAKKLQGLVMAQVWVAADGAAENVKILRSASPALASAAARAVRTWRFRPARNFQGESVPVVVDVAVSFHLTTTPPRATSTASTTAMSKKF
jgi:TonB family protein